VVRLCGHYRLARMLEREDFRSRLDKNLPIAVHELLYPLLTAIDAVTLKSDVELGATEQKFNLLVHREIQREYGLPSQVAMTMPVLVGLDGERKMSKSLGNYVGITDPPTEMFGKIMSISDELMWSYYELLTDFPSPAIVRLREEVRTGLLHPMDAKMQLAHAIVGGFHGEDAAKKAKEEFQRVFRERQAPEEMKEFVLRPSGSVLIVQSASEVQRITGLSTTLEKWSRILPYLRLAGSATDAERLIKQGGFEIDGQPVSNPAAKLDLTVPRSYKLRAGKKRFARIVVG
jgi:tyrosyl-tRNA synthetase